MTNDATSRVSITISVEADFTLAVDEVWPDGDAPADITAAAVRAVMEKHGTKGRTLDDWNLLHDLDVSVCVMKPNPAWKQDETLTGEPAPQRHLISSARCWDAFAEKQTASAASRRPPGVSPMNETDATKKKPLTRDDLRARYERGRALLGNAYPVLVLDNAPIHLRVRIAREIGEYLDAIEAP